METTTEKPFYHRLSHSLLAIGLLLVAVYMGQDILVPLALAGLLAVLLRPVESWLTRRLGMHKVVAISLALLLAVIVITGLAVGLSMQLAHFSDDVPKLRGNLNDVYNQVRRWIRSEYNLSYQEQAKYMKQAQAQTLDSLQGAGSLGIITGPLGTLLLLPIYIFLLMYYRTMLLHFVICLFAERYSDKVRETLGEIRSIIQSYLVGLLLETGCVAVLNSVGLLLLNVQYAILLGVVGAVLNLIPYIGGVIAIVLTILITFMNQPEISTIVGVAIVFTVVQFIDNNLLIPLIIGSKVQVNALISIVGVLLGGALTGVSGMFLSIPLIAIMKVIFDRVDGMEPWGILIGDQTPEQAGTPLFRLKRTFTFRRYRAETMPNEIPITLAPPPPSPENLPSDSSAS